MIEYSRFLVIVNNGTPGGTRQAGRVGNREGVGAVDMDRFTTARGAIYFRGNDGITGDELWWIDLSGSNVAFTESYGAGCGDRLGSVAPFIGAVGSPRLGNRNFAITVQDAQASSGAALLVSFAPNNIPLGFDCRLLLQGPIFALASRTTDPSGMATTPLPISNGPGALGLQAFFQWIVIDPNGPVLGLATVSDGMRVLVGN